MRRIGARCGGGALLGIALLLGVARADSVPALGPLLDTLNLSRPPQRVDAPTFTLPTLGGNTVSLGDLHGRVRLLYFWATW